MEINTLMLGDLGTNCYLLSTEKAAVVIDPGFDSDEVTSFLNENSDKERMIILSHCHYDHISGAYELATKTDTKIAIGELENASLSQPQINLSHFFGEKIIPFSADVLLSDDGKLSVGDIDFIVWHTAGHTVGGICLLTENVIFSGDTLFYESVGRTDFPGGSFSELKKSIIRIYGLDDSVTVYPGHGPATTVGHEKIFNPYVRL